MIDIDAVRDWLARLPGGSLADQYAADWAAFAALDKPVVTLFGSYDTGKSSLLRRLLVDAGAPVPDWLTISARHETFEVNQAELAGCFLRDTPGFTVGATDARAQNNSRRALAAVGLTDIGIAVLTSQLATAERDVLRDLVTQGWPAGTMWFVISRFDEAGVDDPGYDLPEYQDLADRKVRELRDLFDLDARTPSFVVSQDPFQTAGSHTDLDRTTWDEFRGWDGMGKLTDALGAIEADPAWREAAGQRYWSSVLNETVTELRKQLADYTAQAEVAAAGVTRRTAWESELDTLDRAAQASLGGLVEEVLQRSWSPDELQRTLDEWFTRHEARLDRLRQSIRKTRDRERSRPSWPGFAALVTNLDPEQEPATPTAAAGHVETVGAMMIDVLKAAAKPSAKKAAEGWARHIPTAEAVLPLAVYLTKASDAQWANHTRQTQDRAATGKRHAIIDECTQQARDTWQPYVDEIRDEITAQTGDQVDLDASLRRLVEQLHEAVAEGEALAR